MIPTDGNNLSRKKLHRLLKRVGDQPALETDTIDAVDCDWTVPHHFGPEARLLLEGLSRRIAGSFQRTFEEGTHKSAEVTHHEINEYYACRLNDQLSRPDGPYMANVLNETQVRIGFFQVPFETAVFLVAQTLHDPEAAVGQNGQFSSLEESILADILAMFSESLVGIFSEYVQLTIQPGQSPLRGEWRIDARELEDLCELRYRIQCGEQEFSISFVIESCLLDMYAGQPVYFKKMPAEKTKNSILEHVRRAPVLVKAVVCSATIHFRELVELAPGDVLLLGKKIKDPLDVLINGQFCFQAYPACQQGKAALVITEQQEL